MRVNGKVQKMTFNGNPFFLSEEPEKTEIFDGEILLEMLLLRDTARENRKFNQFVIDVIYLAAEKFQVPVEVLLF